MLEVYGLRVFFGACPSAFLLFASLWLSLFASLGWPLITEHLQTPLSTLGEQKALPKHLFGASACQK